MGHLVYSMIVSLDGYVADGEGDFGWAVPDEEVLEEVNAETADVGTFLYGRRMYELMAVWETDPAVAAQSPRSADFARIWQAADKIVYSRTMTQVRTRRTHLEHRFDPDAVHRLKESTSTDLTVDGPTLAAQALRHGLVDRLHLLVCPVSLGGGLSFLPDFGIGLRLRHERRFGNGMVRLRYDVEPAGG